MTSRNNAETPTSTDGRFRPGQSGNRQGRPRKGGSVDAAITNAFDEKVTVTTGGKRRRVSKLDATATQIANKAASGDTRSAKLALDFARKAEERQSRAPIETKHLSESDQQIADRFVKRLRNIIEEEANASIVVAVDAG